MLGYYNRPEETRQVIDRDGYLHTGDLARIDESGHIFITGRTKEIIVLSNGKNVQPNEIEYKLERYEHIVKEAAVMADGDMLRAIIVPQASWAAGRDDREIEQALKIEILGPYNRSVANYKKVMAVTSRARSSRSSSDTSCTISSTAHRRTLPTAGPRLRI